MRKRGPTEDRELHEFNERLRRLPPGHPLRQISLEEIRNRGLTAQDLSLALEMVSGADPPRRAEYELGAWIVERDRIAPASRAALTGLLARMVTLRRPYGASFFAGLRYALRCGEMAGAILAAAAMLAWLAQGLTPRGVFGGLFISAVLFSVVTLGLTAILAPLLIPARIKQDADCANRVRAAAARALGRLKAPESVGALAGAARDSNPAVSRAAAEALLATLPELTEAHYGQLEAQTIPNLCDLLYHHSEALDLAILKALGNVGDGRAIRTVEGVAAQWKPAEMCMEALRILPILRVRHKQEQEAARLLRPASPPDAPSAVLLRPAQGVSETDSQLLLRPVEGTGDRVNG